MRAEAVKSADSLSAQLAASVRREDAITSELAVAKEDFVKSCFEHANLQWSFNTFFAKLRETSVDFGGAC